MILYSKIRFSFIDLLKEIKSKSEISDMMRESKFKAYLSHDK